MSLCQTFVGTNLALWRLQQSVPHLLLLTSLQRHGESNDETSFQCVPSTDYPGFAMRRSVRPNRAHHLQYLNGQEEAEEQLVLFEQAPTYVHVHRGREAVVQVLESPSKVWCGRSLPDRLTEQRTEPRQRVLVHRIDLSRSIKGVSKHARRHRQCVLLAVKVYACLPR